MSQWPQRPLDPITDSSLPATDQQVSNREAQTTLAHFMGDRAEALAAWPPSTGAPTADPVAPAAQGQLSGRVTVVHHPVATAATSRNRESGVWEACPPYPAAAQGAAPEAAARVALGVVAVMLRVR